MSMHNTPPTNLKKPLDWDELYPGRFLKAGQFGDKKVTLTISDVSIDKLVGDDGVAKVKGIISFEKTELQLALNKTNGLCLRELFGRELAKWIGRKVTLYAGEYNGDPCIRVWGSPELKADKTITIKLPKKAAKSHVLHAVRDGKAAPAKQASRPEPAPNVDDLEDDEPADDMDPDPTIGTHADAAHARGDSEPF
jgi:hypothetical protein